MKRADSNIENFPHLKRDGGNSAIINNDVESYKSSKRLRDQNMKDKARIASLEDTVEENQIRLESIENKLDVLLEHISKGN